MLRAHVYTRSTAVDRVRQMGHARPLAQTALMQAAHTQRNVISNLQREEQTRSRGFQAAF